MTAMWVSGIEPPRSRETSLLGAQTFLRCVGAIARWELLLRLPSLRIFSCDQISSCDSATTVG